MEERDIRLLFKAGHWKNAIIIPGREAHGWEVLLVSKQQDQEPVTLATKRGGARIFKTSDAALVWCQQIGFNFVKVQLVPVGGDQQSRSQNISGNGSILLVEDNEDDLDLALYAFKSHQLADKVIVKRDGMEAVDYLFGNENISSRLPRLVILDLNLPRLGGLEVLEKIRQHELTRLLPVVILTGSELDADIRRSYELGVNSYIFKPTDIDQLISVVAQLEIYWSGLNIAPFA